MDRLRSIIGLIFAATIFISPARGLAALPEGISPTLNIKFKAKGGKQWCRPVVAIELSPQNGTEAIFGNTVEFQRMVGRIRSVVTGDCAATRTVEYYLTGSEELVGESPSFVNWAYVPFRTEQEYHPCRGRINKEICEVRWTTYLFVRHIFIQKQFDGIQVTRYLNADKGADIEFKFKKTDGRVGNISHLNGELKAFITANVENRAASCKQSPKISEVEDRYANMVFQYLSCDDYHSGLAATEKDGIKLSFAIVDYKSNKAVRLLMENLEAGIARLH